MPAFRTQTDQQLVALLKAGDEAAFTEIYDRHWATLYYHVHKMLRQEDDSKDVVQEVFSSLWLKREQLRDDTNLSGLLYIQGRNRVLNLIEQQRVRSDYLSAIAAFATDRHNSTIELLDEKELLALVEHEIRSLPPKMREIFELSRKENLSHKEIADRLQLSEQTVKKQVQNALKVIKPKLRTLGSIAVLLFLR